LVNILILRLCNYDKSPDHVESAGKFTLIQTLNYFYKNWKGSKCKRNNAIIRHTHADTKIHKHTYRETYRHSTHPKEHGLLQTTHRSSICKRKKNTFSYTKYFEIKVRWVCLDCRPRFFLLLQVLYSIKKKFPLR
jgi:hypothetical protein